MGRLLAVLGLSWALVRLSGRLGGLFEASRNFLGHLGASWVRPMVRLGRPLNNVQAFVGRVRALLGGLLGCLRAVWRVFRAVVERWKLENVRKNWKAQKPRKNQYKSTILAAWGFPGKPLGALFGSLGGLLGRLLAVLGLYWAMLGPSGPSWGALRGLQNSPEAFWERLGAPWGCLGQSRGAPGAVPESVVKL